MHNVSFAIVGCGAIARKHIASIAACQGAKLAAVCDLNAERMEQMAELWRTESGEDEEIAKITDFMELIRSTSIDIIVIATVSGLHATMAKEALRANKHIILEKPAALSLRDVDDMIRLATERKLFIQVCHQLRYRPLLRKIKDHVMKGDLGRILAGSIKLRLHRSSEYYHSVAWRGTWEQDGGMLLNQGIHAIDLLLWYVGRPERVYGDLTSVHSFKETEDIALGVITFSNGAKGMVEANSVTMPGNLEQSLFLLGDNGAISIGGEKLSRIDRWHIEDQPNAVHEALRLSTDNSEHVYMYRAFVDAFLGKEHAELIDLSEGRRALELIFALYLSAADNRVQHLPISDFSTHQMKQK